MQGHQNIIIVDISLPRSTVSLRGSQALVCQVAANTRLRDARINADGSAATKTHMRQAPDGKQSTEFVLWENASFHVAVDALHIMVENFDTIVGVVLYSRTATFSTFTVQDSSIIETVYSRLFNGINHALITVGIGQALHVESTTQGVR